MKLERKTKAELVAMASVLVPLFIFMFWIMGPFHFFVFWLAALLIVPIVLFLVIFIYIKVYDYIMNDEDGQE